MVSHRESFLSSVKTALIKHLHLFDFDGTICFSEGFDEEKLVDPVVNKVIVTQMSVLIEAGEEVAILSSRKNSGIIKNFIEREAGLFMDVPIHAIGDPDEAAKGYYIKRSFSDYDIVTLHDDNTSYLQNATEILKDSGIEFIPVVVKDERKVKPVKKEAAKSVKAFEDSELISRAKQYDTFEEFLKTFGDPVFHGTNAEFVDFDVQKAGTKGNSVKFSNLAIYVSPDESFVSKYGSRVLKVYIDPKAKFVDYDDIKYLPGFYKWLDSKIKSDPSYDRLDAKEDFAVYKKYDFISYGDKELVVFNSSILKTEASLKNIWDKAHSMSVSSSVPFTTVFYNSMVAFLKELFDINVEVKYGKTKEDLFGFMPLSFDSGVSSVTIDTSGSLKYVLKSIIHELTHIKQVQYGQLATDGISILWEGVPVISVSEYNSLKRSDWDVYSELPFEKEAFANSEELFNLYVSSPYFKDLANSEDTSVSYVAKTGFNVSSAIKQEDMSLIEEAKTFDRAEEFVAWRIDKESGFLDSHVAPGFDDTPSQEKVDTSGDFSLSEIMQGYSSQPLDYFDAKTGPRVYGYNTEQGYESYAAIRKVMDGVSSTLKAYRAVHSSLSQDRLQSGDWITFSKKYAEAHGANRFDGEYKIIEQEVSPDEVWWDGNDINEWGYDNGTDSGRLTIIARERQLFEIWNTAHSINVKSSTDFDSLRMLIVDLAQEVLNSWQPDEDGIDDDFGGGGVCDEINRHIQSVLVDAGFEVYEGGQEGSDHAFTYAVKDGKAFYVDIPPYVYEEGSGYSWKKLEGVKLKPSDVIIREISLDDLKDFVDSEDLITASFSGSLIAYHGSYSDFDSFAQVTKAGVDSFATTQPLFFTRQYKYAYQNYANAKGGIVYKCLLSPKKMFMVTDDLAEDIGKIGWWDRLTEVGESLMLWLTSELSDDDKVENIFMSVVKRDYDTMESDLIVRWIKNEGYDSFEVIEYGDVNISVLDTSIIKILEKIDPSKVTASVPFSALTVGEYSGELRDLAHGIKDGNQEDIDTSGEMMSNIIPDGSVLVPVPSRGGDATTTLKLAEAIVKYSPSCSIKDVLKGASRRSLYDLKKEGKTLSDDEFGFFLTEELPKDLVVYLVDNVIASGSTGLAASKVVPNSVLVALADDSGVAKKSVYYTNLFKNVASVDTDAEYMKAAESGDLETCSRMVKEAAERAGYGVGPVYHGTNAEFTEFDPKKVGKNFGTGAYGKGFYFTDHGANAGFYGSKNRLTVYLRLNNPYLVDANFEKDFGAIPKQSIPLLPSDIIPDLSIKLKRRGFDGVIGKDTLLSTISTGSEYVVYTPEQIKLADPITYSDSGDIIPLSKRFDSDSRDIRASQNQNLVVKVGNGRYGGRIIHYSTKIPGKVQVSYFTDKGVPSGDEVYDSFPEAMVDNFASLNNPISKWFKDFNVKDYWEEVTFNSPESENLMWKKFAYVSPLRPLTGVSVEGLKYVDSTGKVGVLYSDTPVAYDSIVNLTLIPFTTQAKLAFCEGLLQEVNYTGVVSVKASLKDSLKQKVSEYLSDIDSLLATNNSLREDLISRKYKQNKTKIRFDNEGETPYGEKDTYSIQEINERKRFNKVSDLDTEIAVLSQLKEIISSENALILLLVDIREQVESSGRSAVSVIVNNILPPMTPKSRLGVLEYTDSSSPVRILAGLYEAFMSDNTPEPPEPKKDVTEDTGEDFLTRFMNIKSERVKASDELLSLFNSLGGVAGIAENGYEVEIPSWQGKEPFQMTEEEYRAYQKYIEPVDHDTAQVMSDMLNELFDTVGSDPMGGYVLTSRLFDSCLTVTAWKYSQYVDSFLICCVGDTQDGDMLKNWDSFIAWIKFGMSEGFENKPGLKDYSDCFIGNALIVEAKKKHKWENYSDAITRPLSEKYGVSFGKDKGGYFAYTHRARCDSYPSVDKIPVSKLKFIGSTGSVKASELEDQQVRVKAGAEEDSQQREEAHQYNLQILDKIQSKEYVLDKDYNDFSITVKSEPSLKIKQSDNYSGYLNENTNTIHININSRDESESDFIRSVLYDRKVWENIFHEYIHYSDLLRMGRLNYTHPQKGVEKYYNQPVEYNAYYQQAMMYVDKMLNNMSASERSDVLSSFDKFYNLLNMDEGFQKNMSVETQKKLLKRVYKSFSSVQSGKKVKASESWAIPPQLEGFYDLTGDASNAPDWKAQVLVSNSGDTPLGTYEDIYYVLVDLNSNYIIPVARSDEHQLGMDMLYDLYDKYRLPQGKYVPVAVRGTNYLQNRNEENRALTLEAIKKWVSYGGNKVLIEDQTPEGAVRIDSDTFMELGKVEPYKGDLSVSGRYIVDTLIALSDLLNKILKSDRKEPLIKRFNANTITFLEWLQESFRYELPMIMKKVTTGLQSVMASGDDDYSAAQEIIFSHGGIKNLMHNKLRDFEKDPKDFDKRYYQMVFGDVAVAKKEFDMIDPGINVAGSTKPERYMEWSDIDSSSQADIISNIYQASQNEYLLNNVNPNTLKEYLSDEISFKIPVISLDVSEAFNEALSQNRAYSEANLSQIRGYDTLYPVIAINGKFYDGGHRLKIAVERGMDFIPAYEIGPLVDFNWESYFENASELPESTVVSASTKPHVNIVHALNYVEFISDNVTVSDFIAENVPEGSIVLGLYKIPISMLHPTENLDTKNLNNILGMIASLKRGVELLPGSVLFNSETGYFDIFDGHHRYMAYSELEKDMPCIVVAEPESFGNGPVAEGVDMKDQMSKGKEVEKEHDGTYEWIQNHYKEFGVFPPIEKVRESIAKDHILEIENYYDLLEEMEKKAGVTASRSFKRLSFMQPDLIIENEVSWEVFLAYCKKDERALELFVWLTDTFCGKHIPEELLFQYIQCSVENLALNPKCSDDSSDFRFKVYTDNNAYSISVRFRPEGARDSYLGCTYTSRKRDAGEDWNRGGDLADGHFSKETFNDIVSDIIATELVQLYTTKEYPVIRDHFEKKQFIGKGVVSVSASIEPGPVDEVNNKEWYHGNRGLDFPLDYPPVYFSSSPEVAAKFADAGKYTMVVDGEVFLNIDTEQAQYIVDVFEPTYEPGDIVSWGDLLNSGYDEKDVAELRRLLSDMWGLVDVKTFALVLKSVYQSNFYVAKINVKSVKVVDYQGRVWGTTDTFLDVDAKNAFEEGYDCFLGKNVQEGGIAFEDDFPVADTLVVFKKEAVSSFIASEPV